MLLLLVVAVLLRAGKLSEFRPSELDEKSWLMVGVSLFDTGVPSAWTIYDEVYGPAGALFGPVVKPYLDHPPLFSLFVGGWAYLLGENNPENFHWGLVRWPMIGIALASILVTFLFVRRVFGVAQALLTLSAFVFFPSHIIASRIIAPEHLIGLFVILGLYLYAVYEQTERRRVRLLSVVFLSLLCGTALLLKLSGIVVPAMLILMACYRRRMRLAFGLTIAAGASVLIFAGYGYYYNWDLFIDLLVAHRNRAQSFSHFWTLFTGLDVGHFGFFDPSIIVGLIGALSLAARRRLEGKGLYLFAPLLVFSFLFLYIAPWEAYGWYKYAIYPLIAVGLGYVFRQLYQERIVFLILLLPLLSMMLQHSEILDNQSDRRIMIIVYYALAVWPLLFRNRFLQTKPVFVSLLIHLFFFEAVWALRVLGRALPL